MEEADGANMEEVGGACVEEVHGQPSKEIYYVEMVLNSRKNGRTTEYLIKWAGYDSSQSTWEPGENVPLPYVEWFEQAQKGADVEEVDRADVEVEACETEAEKTRASERLRLKREAAQKAALRNKIIT